jgi:hypothetical protein
MGKGTRNRQVRAEDKVVSPSKHVQKQNKSVVYGTWALGIFAIVLVVALLFTGLATTGVFLRSRTAAQTEDFEMDGAMVSYFVHSYYSSVIQQYEEMYSSLIQSSKLSVYDFIGIDPNVSLKKQVKDKTTGETWFQYFAGEAKTQIEEIMVYCQAAKIAGVELGEDELNSIESEIRMLDIYAQLYGYSLNSYIASMYGKGVREKDVRRAMAMSSLASKFAEQVREGFFDASTDEKVQKFFEENKNDYISADYLVHVFTAKKDTKETDADKAKNDYEALKIEIAEYADALASKESVEEFNAYVKENWIKENEKTYRDKYYETYLKDVKKENPDDSEDDLKDKAEKKLAEKLDKDADAMLEGLLVEDYKYTVSTDLGKWVFGEGDKAAATANTTKKVVDESKDKDGTYTITVYYLVRAASKNEDTTRTFSYMMMTSDKYKEEDAKAALELFKKGTINKDELKKLAEGEPYVGKVGFNTLEDFKEGAFGADEVDEWLYADTRAKGDYELITYTIDKTTYYLIVIVDDIGPEEWYVDARAGMVADEVEDWYEAESKKHAVDIDQKVIDKTPM